MAQAVCRRPLTAEVRFKTRPGLLGFVVGKLSQGHVYLRVLQVSASVSFQKFCVHILSSSPTLYYLSS
jgi:hypothetical protein